LKQSERYFVIIDAIMREGLPEFRVIAREPDAWDDIWSALLSLGLRQGELLALRWSDVDLVAGRLVVRRSVWRGIPGPPKGGRSREVALSPEAVRALKAHRHLRGELVFCTDGGRMFTKNECKHPLWRACKRAGLRRIGWHVLRQTFASRLVMRGARLKAVQELLGHATIDMTMRYAHLSPHTRRDAVALLDRGAQREAMGRQKSGSGS
jgi:integrase